MSVSVIIPFIDEEKALPSTLAALCTQMDGGEVIAVDGGSRDDSRAVIERYAARVIDAPRGRAAQMNAGAHRAGGTMLLFLHADTLLPDGAIASLERLARHGSAWGGFRHLFSNADWRLRSISHLHNLRCRVTKVFYGDQAMFVTRDLFHRVGGFPEQLMEDIALSRRLKALCQPVLLPQVVVADSRKFVRMGVWRSLARVALILGCDNLGLPYPRAFFEDVR